MIPLHDALGKRTGSQELGGGKNGEFQFGLTSKLHRKMVMMVA
jgi:hypothetical protein